MALLLLCSLSLSGCISGGEPEEESPVDHLSIAEEFVEAVFLGDHEAAHNLMDEEMLDAFPDADMDLLVLQIEQLYGTMESVSDVADVPDSGYPVAHVTCEHSTGVSIVYRVVVVEGKVSGFFIDDVVEPYTPPSYADLDSFTESDVTIGVPGWELPAVLTMPIGDGPFPAVVLVHGSGANDMDESVGVNKPFKDLAWGLASQGVAVLRYDKRTYVYGGAIAASLDSFTLAEETIDDAVSALDFLSANERIDASRLFIVGHSLGGYAAPLIASESGLAGGLVLLAAPARSLEDLIVEQTRYLSLIDGEIDANESVQIALVEEMAEQVRNLSIEEDEMIFGGSYAYWEYLSDYEPVVVASALDIPVLVLQGERDYQVTMEDFQLWAQGLGNSAVFISYGELNHLMMYGTGPSTPDEYFLGGNVAEEVVEDIADWIVQNV
jgi:fermentation-respiration switch protein FrsA (DUF1100 family)